MEKEYRSYEISDENCRKMEIIHNTYKNQRQYINYEFNSYLINKYCTFIRKGNFWELFKKLDGIVDLSDPDTDLPNSIHALQTAEALRKNGTFPEWMPLVGLIHDMGKIIYDFGTDNDGTSKNTQWGIVGDTFITGCPLPSSLIINQFNILNYDHVNNINMYKPQCGLKNCSVSFGHDEYFYRLLVANNHKMPIEAEYIIRYHSLYAWHSGSDYDYLEDDTDKKMKNVVKNFSRYDLYTKNDNLPIAWTDKLLEYYSELIKKYISNDMNIIY